MNEALTAKLAKIRLFLCDVDGILTDATVCIGGNSEIKTFHIQDGLGLKLLQKEDIQVGWISNRPSTATEQRAKELGIAFLVQNRGGSKVKAAEQILAQTGLTFAEVCYAGDDIVDLALMKRAGVAFSVPNGIEETKVIADYVTQARGGQGAVREMIELILKAQGKWERIVREHME